jgi:hypothetical protein
MMVYREQRRRVATAEVLRRIGEARGFEREMEFGEFHAGVADAISPDCDRDVRNAALPEQIEISVPEGFAYYALDPELYRRSARRFAAEVRPDRVAVIGIRSIGTTLAAIVAKELPKSRVWSVRPRGHPFDRQVRVDYDLARAWLGWGGHFAIVDEGPGLSGSSFASAADFLTTLGIREERIVFFPAWAPDGSAFVNENARRRWQRHRKYWTPFEELHRFDHATDLSAGQWRKLRRARPPVHPQHERRKYLQADRLYKFAGYGRYGRAKLERAERLAGFIPPVLGLEDGFLVSRWVEGRSARPSREFVEHAATYLAHVAREFPTGESADTGALAAVIEQNTGRPWTRGLPDGRAVTLDGRMLPHEWLETSGGFVKTDALDHGDDHFYPGPQDIAWDLAAFGLEFGCQERLLECYSRVSGDHDAGSRVPFYRAAYLAFRLGYCDMAAKALAGSADGARFQRARERYDAMIGSEAWVTTTSRSFA